MLVKGRSNSRLVVTQGTGRRMAPWLVFVREGFEKLRLRGLSPVVIYTVRKSITFAPIIKNHEITYTAFHLITPHQPLPTLPPTHNPTPQKGINIKPLSYQVTSTDRSIPPGHALEKKQLEFTCKKETFAPRL